MGAGCPCTFEPHMNSAPSRSHLPVLLFLVVICLAFAATPVQGEPEPERELTRSGQELAMRLHPLLGPGAIPITRLAVQAWALRKQHK